MNKKQLIIIWVIAFWLIILLGLKKVSTSHKLWWDGETYTKTQNRLYGANIDYLPIPDVVVEYNYRLIMVTGILLALFVFTVKNSKIKKRNNKHR